LFFFFFFFFFWVLFSVSVRSVCLSGQFPSIARTFVFFVFCFFFFVFCVS
jgi:hypothetical protein